MRSFKKIYKNAVSNSYLLYTLAQFLRIPKKSDINRIKNYFKSITRNNLLKKKYRERNERILSNSQIFPKVGYVLNLDAHLCNKWLAGITSYKHNRIIKNLNCIVLENQQDYNKYKEDLDVIIAPEPGYCGPFIKYQKRKPKLKYIELSDPHLDTELRQDYILENNFSFILAIYYSPTLFHFKKIPKKRIISFPRSIPDEFIYKGPIRTPTQNYIMVFGQTRDAIYETRKWCKKFDFVKTFPHSSINKILTDSEYFKWLQEFDAIIAAGSLDPKYKLVMPKYFEVPASGSLLFAQEADDLPLLGFKNNNNCIIFNKENFKKQAYDYLKNKENYVKIRENGRDLILNRHTLSKKIQFLKEHIIKNLNID